MNRSYQEIFDSLFKNEEIGSLLSPFKTAYDNKAFDQLEGQIGTLKIFLSRLATKESFWVFSGDEVEKKIRILSGGEKSRVVLTTILARPINFLVLDEPTNHLDIRSREILLDAIKRFPGTVMIVSHDRHFLREITTRVFELDKQKLTITDGPWEYYQERKSKGAL